MDGHSRSTRPLADMLGDVPPEHDLRGRMIVLVIYACGAVAWATTVFDMPGGWGERLLRFMVGAPFFACAWWFARAVERFACWSWFFVSGLLAVFVLSAVNTLSYRSVFDAVGAAAATGMMMSLGALHYIWLRRWDFWVDARLEQRRTRVRVVTPEWRAARLARIGAGTGRVRRTVSPRPGVLWTRRASLSAGEPHIREMIS